MNRSRVTGDLASHGNIFVDIANDRVGIGSTIPGQKLSLPDSANIALGNSADLRLSFNGTNSVLRDHTGGGSMRIGNNNNWIQVEPNFGQFAAIFKPAETMLFHSNALKFQTTAYGVNVTGTTDTDGLVVSGVTTATQGVNVTDGSVSVERGSVNEGFYIDNGGSTHLAISWSSSASANYFRGTGSHPLNINDHSSISIQAGSGSVSIGQGGSNKIRTKDYGIEVIGTTDTDGLVVSGVTTTSTGINLIASTSNLYVTDGALSYYSANNGVYLNGAGANGWLRLQAAGSSNDRTSINLNGHSASGGDSIHFRTNSTERFRIHNTGSMTASGTIAPSANNTYDLGGSSTAWSHIYGVDLTLTSTDSGAAAAPTIDLVRNSSSPADNDLLGQLRFSGKDDQGSAETYAYITGKILDASAGGEDGILEFTHRKNSAFVITGRWRSDSLQLLNGTNFSVDGTSEFSDLATFTKSGSALRLNDGSILRLGNADADFFLYHDGSSTDYISAGTGRQLRLTTDDFIIKGANNTETLMTAAKDGAVELYHDNVKHFETTAIGCKISDGDTTAVLQFANSDGNNGYVMGESTNIIGFKDNNPHWLVKCIKDGAVELYHDNAKKFETDSAGARVESSGFTHLEIRSTDNDAVLELVSNNDNDTDWTIRNDLSEGNELDFRYNNARKMNLDSSGNLFIAGNLDINDSDKILLGTSDDLQVYHDGSNSYLKAVSAGTGDLYLFADGKTIYLRPKSGEDGVKILPDAQVELYFNNSKKLETVTGGVYVYGDLGFGIGGSGNLFGGDNRKLLLGSGNDLQLFHDGANSYMQHGGTGDLYIDSLNNSADIYIRSKDNLHLRTNSNAQESVVCVSNGGVILYNAGSQKFTTNGSGVSVSGNVVATGNMQVNDNNYLYAGNGGDLRLSHNGSHSFINNQTGDLSIQSDGNLKIEAKDGGDDYIHCIKDGAVEIHHNGAKRIETTATGALVVGVTGSNPTLEIKHSNVDVEGEFVRVERMVQPTIRYHSIKARHSGSTNNNHIAFHIHNADNTTAQTEALKILGSGNLTYSQQAMTILVNATDESTINASDNDDPIHYDTTYVNKGGMTVSESGSRITVPLNGTYLVTGSIAGSVTSESQGDGIQFAILKNGSYQFMSSNDGAWPIESFGTENGMEYGFTLSIPVVASTNDYFELTFLNIGAAVGNVSRGYFSVTKLH